MLTQIQADVLQWFTNFHNKIAQPSLSYSTSDIDLAVADLVGFDFMFDRPQGRGTTAGGRAYFNPRPVSIFDLHVRMEQPASELKRNGHMIPATMDEERALWGLCHLGLANWNAAALVFEATPDLTGKPTAKPAKVMDDPNHRAMLQYYVDKASGQNPSTPALTANQITVGQKLLDEILFTYKPGGFAIKPTPMGEAYASGVRPVSVNILWPNLLSMARVLCNCTQYDPPTTTDKGLVRCLWELGLAHYDGQNFWAANDLRNQMQTCQPLKAKPTRPRTLTPLELDVLTHLAKQEPCKGSYTPDDYNKAIHTLEDIEFVIGDMYTSYGWRPTDIGECFRTGIDPVPKALSSSMQKFMADFQSATGVWYTDEFPIMKAAGWGLYLLGVLEYLDDDETYELTPKGRRLFQAMFAPPKAAKPEKKRILQIKWADETDWKKLREVAMSENRQLVVAGEIEKHQDERWRNPSTPEAQFRIIEVTE